MCKGNHYIYFRRKRTYWRTNRISRRNNACIISNSRTSTKVLNENIEKIENVYITGTASLINNVDLYFQEYLNNVRCEVLKPGFIPVTPDINIKDYIEVNSAIAIALMGLGEGIADMNFRKVPRNERLKAILNLEINGDVKSKMLESGLLTNDLKQPLDRIEKNY